MSNESPPSTGQPLDNNLQCAICNLEFEISAHAIDLDLSVKPIALPDLECRREVGVREARLLGEPPWVRSLGRLTLEVSTAGWRFPAPLAESPEPGSLRIFRPVCEQHAPAIQNPKSKIRNHVRLRPPSDAVLLKDRLLYLLQPPLENLFSGKQARLASQPYPYQFEGIAFLMPRHAALLADEMGLGKTMQAILALRLLFHGGLIRRALVVCPKPLVINWTRELRTWAEDVPFEVVGGDLAARRASWFAS